MGTLGSGKFGVTVYGGADTVASGLIAPPGIGSSELWGTPSLTGGIPTPQVIADVGATVTNSLALPVTKAPKAPGAGSTLLLFVTNRLNQSFTSCTDTKGNTWVQDIERSPGGCTCAIWRCSSYTTQLTTSDTITISGTGLSSSCNGKVVEFYNLLTTSSPLDHTNFGDGSSVSLGTQAQADEIIVSVTGADGPSGSYTYTPSSGWNLIPNNPGVTNWMGGVAFTFDPTTGSETVSWSATPTLTETLIASYKGASVPQTVSPSGIASAEAFGSLLVEQAQTVSPSGIPSAQAFGTANIISDFITPTGIPSAQAFGTAKVILGKLIHPTGIPTSEGWGRPKVQRGRAQEVISPVGIVSAQAFGTPTLSTGPVSILPVGIPGAEAFGLEGIGHPIIVPVASGTGMLPFMLVRRSGLRH